MTPLVFVHGFMGGSDQWALQAPLAAGRTLITIDLPGFGKNAAMTPETSIAGFAKWVLGELSSRGVQRFDLLGHSMGGMIAQEMIYLAPERVARLVLYGTGAAAVLPGRFETINTSMKRAHTDGAKSTARRIAATWFLDKDAAREYPACAEIAEQSSLAAILAGLEAMRGWSRQDNLLSIAAPALILWGDSDRTYSWSQTQNLWTGIRGSQLAVAPACAHAVHLERPELFNQIVHHFLEHTSSSERILASAENGELGIAR